MSRHMGSTSARWLSPESVVTVSTMESSSRSTRSMKSTISTTRVAHAAPIPRPAPVTIPTAVMSSLALHGPGQRLDLEELVEAGVDVLAADAAALVAAEGHIRAVGRTAV